MKKTLALLLVAGSTLSLSACGGIPTCHDELNECNRGGAYTEERTSQAGRYKTVLNKKQPAPQPAPAPAPVRVEPAPAPAPAPEPVIIDTQIMRDAEPEFKQISK